MSARSTACKPAFSVLSLLLCLLMLCTPVFAESIGDLQRILYAEGDAPAGTCQMSLGGAIADAAIYVTGADAAIIPAEDLLGNLLPGEVTEEALADSVADSTLVTVRISAAEFKEYLEYGYSHLILNDTTKEIDYELSDFDGFPQIGGFSCRADLSAPVGERVSRILLSDGTEPDTSDAADTLILVTTADVADGTLGYPAAEWEDTGITEREALTAFINSGELTENYDGTDGLEMVGYAGYSIAAKYPLGWMALAGILIVLFSKPATSQLMETLRNRWQYDEDEEESP